MENFRAYRVHDDGKFGSGRAETMTRAEFDAGNVAVRIAFASVDYKDALTARGNAKTARTWARNAGAARLDRQSRLQMFQTPCFPPGRAAA